MEVDLANMLFGWLLHIDLANIGTNSDGTTAAEAAAAAGTGLALSDLFGPWPRPGVGDTENPQYSDTSPQQTVPPGGSAPSDPATALREHQRLQDQARQQPQGGSTAGPPQPTWQEQGGHFLNRGIRGGITGKRE